MQDKNDLEEDLFSEETFEQREEMVKKTRNYFKNSCLS